MNDQRFDNTVKTIQLVATVLILSLVALVLYHGVVLGQFNNSINF